MAMKENSKKVLNYLKEIAGENVTAADVAADFEANLDWTKWVCVAPSDAMTAVKDNMVLCLMAADANYTQTAAGITAAGWTTVNTLTNPMQ